MKFICLNLNMLNAICIYIRLIRMKCIRCSMQTLGLLQMFNEQLCLCVCTRILLNECAREKEKKMFTWTVSSRWFNDSFSTLFGMCRFTYNVIHFDIKRLIVPIHKHGMLHVHLSHINYRASVSLCVRGIEWKRYTQTKPTIKYS